MPPRLSRRNALLGAGATLAAPEILHAQTTPASLRGQTIVVNWPEHPHYDVARTLLPDFTAATGIKVELDRMQYLRMHDKQVLEMAKSSGDYDVVPYVVMWKTEYATRKFIEPLEPWLSHGGLADPAYDRDDLVTGYYQNIGLVGGPRGYLPGPGAQLYGIPFGAETSILAYRTDVLAKYNLTPPATYDELLTACHIIRDGEGANGMGALTSRGQAGHQVMAAWLLHFTPHNGVFFDEKWQPHVQDAPGVKAAEIMKTIVETGPPGIPAFGFGEMQNAFLQGQAALYLDSIAVFGPVRNPKQSRIDGKVGYAVHPRGTTSSGETGGFGLAIPRNSANKEAAFTFIQWMTSKAQDKRIALAGGVAARWSTVNDPDVVGRYPEYKVLKEALKFANPDWRPIIPQWDEINQGVMGVAMSNIITGQIAPQAGLDEAVPKLRAIMERGGYYRS